MSLYNFCLALVLPCCLLSSQSLAGKTTRRFFGVPDSDGRVNNVSSENSKTLIVRHNLPGRVWLHESSAFWVELQLSTPEGYNNSDVKTLYKLIENDTILLQVYTPSLPPPVETSSKQNILLIISASVGSFVFLCLLVSALCYFCYWRKRHAGKTGTEKPQEKFWDGKTMSSKRRFYEAGAGGTQSRAVLTVGMVLAVCACVLQAQFSSPSVEVTVFFPRGFLRQDSKVFLNAENNNEMGVITNDTDFQVKVFDVQNASLVYENRCTGKNLTCINGACDSLTGKCTCPRKMKLDKQKGQCVYRCEDRCPTGFYEFLPCNRTHMAVCKKCRPLCSFKEFETVPCAGRTDRNCTDISKLPQIKVSPNIAYEDRIKAMEDPSVTRTVYNLSESRHIWLNRSTGLGIQVKVLHVDFSSTFVEVDHTANDNGRLPNRNVPLAVMNNLCSSPVPDFYRLSLQESSDTFRIKKENPGSPCPRYDGKSKAMPHDDRVLTCNGAENPLVRLFGVKNKTESFFQEERTARCHSLKQGCDSCREKCTVLARNTPICNLTKADSDDDKQDYGEHFTYCFDCCFQENCTCRQCDCFKYEKSCLNSQIPCVEVKQFKVSIDPIFQEKNSFKCHVALRRRPSFHLESTIWKDGKLLTGVDMREANRSKEARARLTRDYGFLILRHPSVLISGSTKKDILIRGKLGRSSFDVGWYKTTTEEVSTTETSTLSVQAIAPFTINSKDWPKKECQTVLNTQAFVEVPASSSISCFEKFPELEAELGQENQIRVFKVYNKTGARQVQFELPNNRSILRYVFQEAVIFNDQSFSGRLLKNRTFWTIRLSGQVSTCPASFSVRLTDQDQPDVDVYRYDIAITNEDCHFVVEFHLPSGGDTSLIDKQFVVRLTDARKTVKLILVSPRGIPDLKVPELDDEFDPKRLEILIPFGGAAGGMFLLLIALLIFGYKTRPRDKYHRDRDNSLHFRHVLFVVWFVGMRLIKSFLLTLTVFSVILVAIHYKNVSTLQQYKEFHEQRTKVEDDYMKLMDTHKVQEINRQLMIMDEGKVICDRKLKELNSFLERHFREMKERQEEEMRRKSIVRAAVHRIMKQFNETKAKFERERRRLNKAMNAYAEEINSRISKIEDKVKNSFWLKAARILYKILDALASIFGSGIGKPFIKWVGLNVQFPNIDIQLNPFDDIFSEFEQASLFSPSEDNASNESIWKRHFERDLRINVHQISFPDVNISSPLSKEKAEELLALEWIIRLYNSGVFSTILVLLDILWFVYRHSKSYQLAVVLLHGFPKIYELEKIQQSEEKKEKKKKKKEEKLRKKQEKEATEEGKGRKERRKGHKHDDGSDDSTMENNDSLEEKAFDEGINDPNEGKKDKSTEKRGKEANTNNSEPIQTMDTKEAASEKIKTHGLKNLDRINSAFLKFFIKLKQLNYQINNTNLVPMCVLVVIGILSAYVVIVTAKHSMNVDTLDVLGFFELKMAPLLTMRKIVNTRITSNAFMVNNVRIPYYENRVNARIELLRKRAKVYQAYQCAKADLHNEEYCSWASELGESCDGVGPYNEDFLSNLTQFECHLDPVYPQRFTKFDRIGYKDVYKKALSPYVAALRGLILDTFYMILIVIGIFIIIKIFGIVVFLLMKKLDLVRQVKHYQANQDLLKEASLPHCIKYNSRESAKPIRSVAISNEIRDKCGPLINEGYHTVWR